jgi:hypothetical protein
MLVVIGALALPAMRGPLANQRLRKAGELVRVQWTKASVRAMKTGQIQMFRFQPGGGSFWVQPYFTERDWLEADAASAQSLPAGPAAVAPMASAARPGEQAVVEPGELSADAQGNPAEQLPEDVFFVSGYVQSDTRSAGIQQEVTGNLAPQDQADTLILFYPDGTTSDAELVLSNQYQLNVRVTLRGLTGVAQVSPLLTADELLDIQQQMR